MPHGPRTRKQLLPHAETICKLWVSGLLSFLLRRKVRKELAALDTNYGLKMKSLTESEVGGFVVCWWTFK